MTEPDDRVDAVVDAFLDHLEGLGEAPALDALDADERARAEALIGSLVAGRGIDPYATRPSVERLLAGTALDGAVGEGDLRARIRGELTRYAPFHVGIWPDEAAVALGVDSDFVARVSAQRLRIRVLPGVRDPAALTRLDPAAVAGPVFGAFPDTAGVVVVVADDELSSIAIDPFDVEHCIETPAGTVAPPATHRPVLPLADTVRAYLDEIAPALDTTAGLDALPVAEVDPAAIARDAARRAVERVVLDGRRAKIAAKQETWSALGQAEADAIGDLVADAIAGLDAAALEARIDALAEAA